MPLNRKDEVYKNARAVAAEAREVARAKLREAVDLILTGRALEADMTHVAALQAAADALTAVVDPVLGREIAARYEEVRNDGAGHALWAMRRAGEGQVN